MRTIRYGIVGVALSGPLAGAVDLELARVGPGALLAKAEYFVGRTVEVDIVESLRGPATAEQLARAEYGQVRVAIPDFGGADLSLVPAGFRLEDPDRYRLRFDHVLAPPLRVRGELLEDPELRRGERRSYVIRVESIEPLPSPAPIRVASVDELLADPARFDRAIVEIEGTHETRFEVSALEKKIWLSTASDARVVGTPARGATKHRVRVVGTLFSKPGAHYGHLGGYPLMLVAREIEYR
jgi:hypothetical protein